jgi:hypothetical protein
MAANAAKHVNERVPGFETFYPLNKPEIGNTFPSVCSKILITVRKTD